MGQPSQASSSSGSGLSFPTATAPPAVNNGPQGFSLPPLPTPSDPKAAAAANDNAAALTAAASGSVQSTANPVPSHGIVPTLQ